MRVSDFGQTDGALPSRVENGACNHLENLLFLLLNCALFYPLFTNISVTYIFAKSDRNFGNVLEKKMPDE